MQKALFAYGLNFVQSSQSIVEQLMADFNFLQVSEQDADGTKMRPQLAGWTFPASKFDSDRLCKPGWKVMFGGRRYIFLLLFAPLYTKYYYTACQQIPWRCA